MDKQYVGLEQEMYIFRDVELKVPSFIYEISQSAMPENLKRQLMTESGIRIFKSPISPKKFKNTLDGYAQKERHEAGATSYLIDGVWMDDGGLYYVDGLASIVSLPSIHRGCSEFCTPPIEIKKGFASKVAEVAMEQRARAVKYGTAKVHSTHYNKTSHLGCNNDNIRKLIETIGPAYSLLFSNRNSGIAYRGESGWRDPNRYIKRIELCSSALMSLDQLEAGVAFFAGTMEGIEKIDLIKLPLELRGDIKLKNRGHRAAMNGYQHMVKINPDVILNTYQKSKITALEYFQTYLDFFRKDIEEIATGREMEILDELASGKRRFEMETKPSNEIDRRYIKKQTGKGPEELIKGFKPEGAAELFSDAAKNPVKNLGKIRRETNRIWWDVIDFSFYLNEKRVRQIYVPFHKMEEYLEKESLPQDRFLDYIRSF